MSFSRAPSSISGGRIPRPIRSHPIHVESRLYAAILSTWALLAGMALIMLGNGLQGTLLGVRAAQESFDTLSTGLIMTCFFSGFWLGSVLTPKIIRRVGHIRVFAALASLASAAVLLHALAVSPVAWGVIRIVTGLCFAGLYVIAESWLNDRATNETRGALLSAYMLVSLGGMICGQLLINVADTRSFELFVLVSVLVSVAVVPIALTAAPAPRFEITSNVRIRQLYDVSPLGVIGMIGQGVANGALISMAAVYAQQVGMTIAQTAWFAAAPLIGGFLLQWPIGRVSDHFDRRIVLTATAFAAAVFALLASAMTNTTSHLLQLTAAALIGGVTLPQYSLCIAHTNDHLEPAQMMAGSSTLTLLNSLGLIAGPTVAAVLMTNLDEQALFLAIGVVELALAVFALYRMTARAPVPLEDQGTFVSLNPRSSPVVAQAAIQATLDQED
jgi:MFS family permease